MLTLSRRHILALGAGGIAGHALCLGRAAAQSRLTEEPTRLVIPFAAGGVYDAVGRPLAEKLKAIVGPIVSENLVGAGGSRGASAVVHAKPDGRTLLVGGTSEQVILPLAAAHPPYDPLTDLSPIARIGLASLAFVAHPSVPVQNLAELVDYVKRKPGELSFGTPGAGTLHHLTGELFNYLVKPAGIVHVPYSGAGPALNDLIGGHIQLAIVIVSAQVHELHRARQLRMLAVTTPRRLAEAPDVSTAVEAGLPDLISQFFIGLFAPKATPPEIVASLTKATNTVLADRELRGLFDAASFETDESSGPDQLREFLRAEIARWAPVVKASGFKLN